MNVTQGLRRVLADQPRGDRDRRRRPPPQLARHRRARRKARGRVAAARDQARRPGRGADARFDRYLELYLGIAWAGAVIVPTNIRWSHAEIEDLLHDCRASIFVVDKAFAAMGVELARAIPLKLVYADDDAGPAGAQDYEKLVAASSPVADARPRRRAGRHLLHRRHHRPFQGRDAQPRQPASPTRCGVLAASTFAPDGTVYLHAAPMFHLADLARLVPR